MRLINDIRLSGLEIIGSDVETSGNPFTYRKYNLIGRRYAAKLHSIDFAVGVGGDIFTLQLKSGLPHGDVAPDFEGLCRRYSCGLNREALDALSDRERQDFLASCITKMMLFASRQENLGIEKIQLVDELIHQEREKMAITLVSAEYGKWSVRVDYTICDESVLSVTATDQDNLNTVRLVELQLDEYQDAPHLAGAVKFKKSSVKILARPGLVAEHTLLRYSEKLGMQRLVCDKKYFEIPLPPCN